MENEHNHTGGKVFGALLVIILVIVISWFALQQGLPEQTTQQQTAQEKEVQEKKASDEALVEAVGQVQEAAEEIGGMQEESEQAQEIPAAASSFLAIDALAQSTTALERAQEWVQQIEYASLNNPALVKYKWASTNLRQAEEARAYACTNQFFTFEREAIEALAFLSCVPVEDSVVGGSVMHDKSIVAFRREDTSRYAPSYLLETPGFLDCPDLEVAEEAIQAVLQSDDYFVVHAMQQECVEEQARADAERALQLARNAVQEQQYLKASWNYRNAWNYVRACQC